MGRLVERLRITCEMCKQKALPNTIVGSYSDRRVAIIHECPMCGYIRHHGQIGAIEYAGRRVRHRNRTAKGYGRFATYLLEASNGYRV